MSIKRASAGFTLFEMIIAIIILSIGITGVLLAYSTSVRNSADAVIDKQKLAIAETLLEEVLLKPYAISGVAPTNNLTDCGPAAARNAFDDVRDYNNYRTTSACDIDGVLVAGLAGYAVSVTVQVVALDDVAAGDALQVIVNVTRNGETVTLSGIRTAYASL